MKKIWLMLVLLGMFLGRRTDGGGLETASCTAEPRPQAIIIRQGSWQSNIGIGSYSHSAFLSFILSHNLTPPWPALASKAIG